MRHLSLPVVSLGTAIFFALTSTAHALNGGTSRITTSNNWKAVEVISAGDNPAGGANYTMPTTQDGTGAYLVDANTLRLLVNHEETDASISETDVHLANLQLVISNMITNGNTGGVTFVTAAQQAYARWSANGGSTWTSTTDKTTTSFYRFCSAQSYEPDTFGPNRGFVDHVFITGEEGSTNRLFVLETATRDLYQLSGVTGNASGVLGGIGGMPFDAWENAALLDTGETQHVALVLSPDGGTQRMQLYIGIKGKDANGNNSSSFLARNGLAYGSYFYFNDTLPTTTPSTDGFFDATTAGSLVSTKLEDIDTSPVDPTRFVLGDQDSGAFVFDTNLFFSGGTFNVGASSFSITRIDDPAGSANAHDNVDWTDATNLGGTSYPDGLVFVNEDNTTGEIWQMNPDGTNQIKVGQTNVGAESSGIFDLSAYVGYKPASILMTSNQGTPGSLTILIHPSAALLDMDNDGVADVSDNCPVVANADQADFDTDLEGDACDTDDDNDSVPDVSDAFPLNAAEWADADGDGTGNNADMDDDNDTVPDVSDAFPFDASESLDTDIDGIGNNVDHDDDGDSVPDVVDQDPLDAGVTAEIVLPLNGVFKGSTVRDDQNVQ
jgi:hypothetical protein